MPQSPISSNIGCARLVEQRHDERLVRRYGAGETNEWIVTYDEVIFVIEGRYTVRGEDGAKTAEPREVIFLTKGTKVTYEAEVATRVVGATYPHWQDAQRRSSHAHMLDDFHPA